MYNQIKSKVFAGWHPLRWTALGIGLIAGYHWLTEGSAMAGLLAAFFLFQAVTNTGCLGGHCSTPAVAEIDKSTYNTDTDPEFEEIK
jgi:hypothetical protein